MQYNKIEWIGNINILQNQGHTKILKYWGAGGGGTEREHNIEQCILPTYHRCLVALAECSVNAYIPHRTMLTKQ